MAKVVSTSSTRAEAYRSASNTNIESAFEAFLKDLGSATAAAKARPVVELLSEFLNNSETTEWRQNPSFTQRSQPSAIIPHLDRYLRYNIMRELVLNFDQMEFIFYGTYALCEWLELKQYFSTKEALQFELLKQEQMSKWQKAISAVEAIDKLTLKRRSGPPAGKQIEFGRHDIAKIDGDQIWLEIWSLTILPDERNVGPITLPKKAARLLEEGWIISCSLCETKTGWQIVESGNIYPALPF